MPAMYARVVACLLIAWMPLSAAMGASREIVRLRARKAYSLKDMYRGSDFFSNWSFFTGPDPTNGNVNYLGLHDAMNQGLAHVDSNGTLILAVDSTSHVPSGGNRNSIRITSNNAYTGGLFILDAVAMPVGCGTWPSFWTNGPNWPSAGEIDIVEGINNQQHNQMTLHSGTSDPCTIDLAATKKELTGNVIGTQCHSTETNNGGCSITDPETRSFAYGFNAAEGGVFAMLWDETVGISIWHFARNEIPDDIINQAPTPANWSLPVGYWSAASCNITNNFYSHSMILDTTICGGWAGDGYSKSGCPGTCSEMVANASNFADAKWKIKYVAVYQ